MRYIFEILAAVLIGFIASKSEKDSYPTKKSEATYKVYKINSINTWYLIYAKKGDSLYKIVSKKMEVRDGDRIEVDKRYKFLLHSRLHSFTIAGETISPQNNLLVNCFSFDDSTNICLERDSINDLHYADNVKGLCFIK